MDMIGKHPAGEIEANGITVPIFVDDHGSWIAEYDGRQQSYPTREKLETRLKTLTRRARVEVEVRVIKVEHTRDSVRYTRATLTGIHGANGNVLAVMHHGGRRGDIKEQVAKSWGGNETFFGGDMTDEQLREYQELVRAKHAAETALRKARARYEIKDVKETVQRVVDAASGSDEA